MNGPMRGPKQSQTATTRNDESSLQSFMMPPARPPSPMTATFTSSEDPARNARAGKMHGAAIAAPAALKTSRRVHALFAMVQLLPPGGIRHGLEEGILRRFCPPVNGAGPGRAAGGGACGLEAPGSSGWPILHVPKIHVVPRTVFPAGGENQLRTWGGGNR